MPDTLNEQSAGLVSLASSVRGEPGVVFMLIGLVLLGVGVIVCAIAMWRSAVLPKWIGIPLAVGFALYIPQYTAPQYLRVAHGLLITVSCVLVAVYLLRTDVGPSVADRPRSRI